MALATALQQIDEPIKGYEVPCEPTSVQVKEYEGIKYYNVSLIGNCEEAEKICLSFPSCFYNNGKNVSSGQ